MNYVINGELVKGGPVEVVEALKCQAYDHDRFRSLEEYMEWLTGSIWRFHGKGVTIHGESLEERCSSLVSQLVSLDLVTQVKD